MFKNELEYLKLNKQGLIPGPKETETEFYIRASYCLKLKESLFSQLSFKDPLDFSLGDHLIRNSTSQTKHLFDIALTWTPVIFSNERLAPWHAGAAWIFQISPEAPTAAFFQLRSVFAKKNRFLGIYDRQEIISHEAAHVGRMLFAEPKFEELLAYRTSETWFRRYFGPIVQAPWESVLFVILLFLSLVVSLLSPVSTIFYITSAIPFLLLLLGIFRVSLRQYQFSHCLKNLNALLCDQQKTNAVAYRLTDKEIILFSRMDPSGIRKYAEAEKELSLRWKTIFNSYFKEN